MNLQSAAINSSFLSHASYDADNLVLTITMNTGNCYRYFNVPFVFFDELVRAESAGQYYNDSIRNGFESAVIEHDDNYVVQDTHHFNSSFLEVATFNRESQQMFLSIRGSNRVYPMTSEAWEQFIHSTSAGAYFNSFIRGHGVQV